jgi:tape measure domain-containing protein
MADAIRRISIRLSLDEGGTVERQLEQIGRTGDASLDRLRRGAEQASGALDLLSFARQAAGALALGQAFRSLVAAGDAYTASLGRLAQATGSIERARDLYELLYRNALQTGVAVTESVDAFQRFAIAARAIGATSDQVAQLVGGLQRAAIVGGSSAQEIGSATLQLAQALASGRLQGDELRAVLEAMPLLAEALAAELGVSVGQLRELGSEGQLTAERIFPALLRASERLNAEFERAPLTLGRAFGQLEAAAGNFLAQLDQAVGLTLALAQGISAAAQALDRVRGGVGLLSPAEALADRRRQAQALAGEIARLEAGEFLPPARRGTIQRGAVATAMAQTGVGPQQRLAELRQQYLELIAEIELAERDAALRGIAEREQAEGRAAQARRERARQQVTELTEDLDRRVRIEREHRERIAALDEAVAAGALDPGERDRLAALATNERAEALKRLERSAREATSAEERRLDTLRRQVELAGLAEERERFVAERVAGLTGAQRAEAERLAKALFELQQARKAESEALQEAGRLYEETRTPLERYVAALERLGELRPALERRFGAEGADEIIGRRAQGLLDELGKAEQQAGKVDDVARQLGLTFESAFESAIVRGQSFGDVLRGIEQDLLRLGTRKLVTEPLLGVLSGLLKDVTGGEGISGLFSGLGSFLAGLFHEGGTVGASAVPTRRVPALAFAGAPRLHNGWFRPDEYPAILQRGEVVIPRQDARRAMTPAPATVVVNITTPDAESFRASQGQVAAAMARSLQRAQRSL